MYVVVFVLFYCRRNRQFTGHISECMQFANVVVDVDGAEAFAKMVELQLLARLLRENTLYHHHV